MNILTKILVIILAVIICSTLYIFIHIKADEKAKDLFEWGYWAGLIIGFILDIVLKIIK